MGPFLFNIFICDIIFRLKDYEIANYVDDSIPYSAKRNHKEVQEIIQELEQSLAILFKWLQSKKTVVNTGKRHLFLSGKINVNIDGNKTEPENKQELLRVIINSNFSFEDHINNMYEKTSQKLSAVSNC